MPNTKDLVLRLRSITDQFRTDQPVRELEDLERELKGASDQASKSAREVRRAADDLDAPGFDKAAAEAETTARRMRTAAGDMGDGIRQGAHDIDTATGDIKGRLGETGREAGAELIGNIAEGIGSGQATLRDTVQGTLGGITNLAASMPGIGTAAAVAAAGVGLAFAAINKKADQSKARIDNLIGSIEDIGTASEAALKEDIWNTWVSGISAAPKDAEAIADALRTAGVNGNTLKNAVQGNADAQEQVRQKLAASQTILDRQVAKQGGMTAETQHTQDGLDRINDALSNGATDLQTLLGLQGDMREITGKTADNTASMADGIVTAKERADDLNASLDWAFRHRDMSINVKTNVTDNLGRQLLADPRTRRHLDISG